MNFYDFNENSEVFGRKLRQGLKALNFFITSLFLILPFNPCKILSHKIFHFSRMMECKKLANDFSFSSFFSSFVNNFFLYLFATICCMLDHPHLMTTNFISLYTHKIFTFFKYSSGDVRIWRLAENIANVGAGSSKN